MSRTRRLALIPAILAGVLAILMLIPCSAAAMPEAQQLLPASSAAAVPESKALEVVEHLRLRVSAATRSAWLRAERECWDPWLRRQPGFLGRELYWNPEREEGVLLIRWADQESWDAIPRAEIDAVQERFEASARQALGVAAPSNPFPLLESSSLLPVGQT